MSGANVQTWDSTTDVSLAPFGSYYIRLSNPKFGNDIAGYGCGISIYAAGYGIQFIFTNMFNRYRKIGGGKFTSWYNFNLS